MIIRTVTFENFGVYGGRHELDLAPRADGAFDRPIILFHGKNGVGKTSFVEGIRLSLHGSLALGRRVSRRRYLDHLRRRIHRSSDTDAPQAEAALVSVVFDFVRAGVPHTYEVTRRWRSTGIGLDEGVEVLEDGEPPEDVGEEGYDAFLRELIPASAGDLFFFDGEKIDRLVDDEQADGILADAAERLFGLHLASQLDTDLDVFITRSKEDVEDDADESALEAVQEERDAAQAQVDALLEEQQDNREALGGLRVGIDQLEQELATKGGAYAKRYGTVKKEKEKLEVQAEAVRRQLQDLAGGLLPLAFAPKMSQHLLDRLSLEARYHRERAAASLLEERKGRLTARLRDDELWVSADLPAPDERGRERLAELLSVMLEPSADQAVSEEEVFVHASEQDRAALAGQLREALGPVAEAFHAASAEFLEIEEDLEQARHDLAIAPPDEELEPLVESLQALEAERLERQEREGDLAKELGTAMFHLERAKSSVEKEKEALALRDRLGGRVGLAVRAQRAIREYAGTLRTRKLRNLERELVRRFNELCRKSTTAAGFLESAHIDAGTFAVFLTRGGRTFDRSELSAGEKQLFAVATLWALRDVAGLPMPVVVDTPLGRLDSDHRSAMIRTFFPQVAHQVVLLATDTEVDRSVEMDLAPSLSHGYRMSFDPETGSTTLEEIAPEDLFDGELAEGSDAPHDDEPAVPEPAVA